MKKNYRQSASARRGMTLIELMVAVALLAIMIASFSMILNNVQQLVYGSQITMRANSAASAVEQVIRNDIRSVSMNGFLCITQVTVDGVTTPQLFYTTAGTTMSLTGKGAGDGSVTGLGLCKMNGGPDMMMWRAGWVLTGTTYSDDAWSWYFSDIQKLSRSDLNSACINTLLKPGAPTDMTVPPQNLTDISNLWKYLVENCSGLSIMWTDDDPATTTALKWYGASSPKDSGYASKNVNSKDGSGNYYAEFNDGGYRALWSQHNSSDWPKALKIGFTLNNISTFRGTQSITYEIICPLSE